MVWGVDTLTGKDIEIAADMVVLAQAMRPSTGAQDWPRSSSWPWTRTASWPKPIQAAAGRERDVGMFLAGAAQAPKDIPEAVAQASGAASKAVTILSQDRLFHSPTVAKVISNLCTGCGMCVAVCPYDALALKDGKVTVNEVLCEGCGTCTATCLRSAIQVKNLTQNQVAEMINACLGG